MKQITLICAAYFFTMAAFTQTKITGTVLGDSIALPGANVIIKGSKKGAFTTVDGVFEIEAQANDTLLISYLGFTPKEIIVGKQHDFKVNLTVGNTLDEVLITTYSSRCATSCLFCISYIYEYPSKTKITPKLFPNPSKDGIFKLNLQDSFQQVEILVATFSGQIIQQTSYHNINKNITVNLSQFPVGIYLIHTIADGKTLETKKAIKS